MRTVRITLDEELLAKIDADAETKRYGRSVVFRRAIVQYLKNHKRMAIAEAYRNGYLKQVAPGPEFAGWDKEGGPIE
jgi:metal-responsive CopG/Arc/MetJ family transcriptional regulator